MKQLLKLLLVVAFAFNLSIQDCKNPYLDMQYNPYFAPSQKDSYNSPYPDPITAQNLTVCKQYNNKPFCCSNEIMNDMKKYFDQLKSDIHAEIKKDNQFHSDLLQDLVKNKNRIIRAYYETQESLKQAQEAITSFRQSFDENVTQFQNQLEDYLRSQEKFLPEVNEQLLPSKIKDQVKAYISQNEYDFVNNYIKMAREFLNETINSTLEAEKSVKNITQVVQDTIDSKGESGEFKDMILQSLNQEEISNLIWEAQSRMRKYVKAKSDCFSTLLKHQASIMCLACDPDYSMKGIYLQKTKYGEKNFIVSFPLQVCKNLMDKCYDYIDMRYQMNMNNYLAANTLSMQFLDLQTLSKIQSNDSEAAVQYFNSRVESFQQAMLNYTFYKKPNNCISKQNCRQICSNFIDVFGINKNRIFNDTKISNQNTVNKNMNYFFQDAMRTLNKIPFFRRLQQENKTEQEKEIENAVDNYTNYYYNENDSLMLEQWFSGYQMQSTLFFANDTAFNTSIVNPVDTIELAVSNANDTNLDSTFDGKADVDIFNFTETVKEEAVVENVPMPNDLGVKSELPPINETSFKEQLEEVSENLNNIKENFQNQVKETVNEFNGNLENYQNDKDKLYNEETNKNQTCYTNSQGERICYGVNASAVTSLLAILCLIALNYYQ